MAKEATQKSKEINRYMVWTITRIKCATESDPLNPRVINFTKELLKTAKEVSTKEGIEKTISYCQQVIDQYFKDNRFKKIGDLYTKGSVESVIRMLETKREKDPQGKVTIDLAAEKREAERIISSAVFKMLNRRNKTTALRYQIFELFNNDPEALKAEIESLTSTAVEKIEVFQNIERNNYPKHAYYGKIQYITQTSMPIVVVKFTGKYCKL
jgi:hypothetical protein